MLADQLKAISTNNRISSLQARVEGEVIKGDFAGSVTGFWEKLGDSGEGIVKYKSKSYVTKPIGFTSIPSGTEVELSYANGIYYSKF